MKKSKQAKLSGIKGTRYRVHRLNGVPWLYAAGVPIQSLSEFLTDKRWEQTSALQRQGRDAYYIYL